MFMTPLEAMREIVKELDDLTGLTDLQGLCPFCGGLIEEPPSREYAHQPECAWLFRKQIVKALEAATVMATRMARQTYCNGCGRNSGDLHRASSHDPTCERWALISAIQGDALAAGHADALSRAVRAVSE